MTRDERYMLLALKCAQKAKEKGEVPVGAVIVKGDEVIAKAHNEREKRGSAIAHAEIIAIEKACKKLGDWRLDGCEIFVTLEPCPMCAGAIFNARLSRLVYAAKDEKMGFCGSVCNIFHMPIDAKTRITTGVLESTSLEILKDFFQKLRNKTKEN